MNHEQTPMSVGELKVMAATIRCEIINMIHEAKAGHPGGSLSAADLVTAENNVIFGGLGSAVAEILAENLPIPMERIGILQRFILARDRASRG